MCVHVLECLPLEFAVESGHHVVPAQLAPNQSGSEDLGVNPPSKWKAELFSHNSGRDFQITNRKLCRIGNTKHTRAYGCNEMDVYLITRD